MTVYQHAAGLDNEIELSPLVPQPTSRPAVLQTAGVSYDMNNGVNPEGEQSQELAYSFLFPDEFNALNTRFGISETTRFAEGTFTLRKNDDTDGNFNGIIWYPVIGSSGAKRTFLGWENVVYPIHGLEELL